MVQIYDSFSTLSEQEFDTYSKELVNGYPSSAERKQAIAFLQQVSSADKATIQQQKSSWRASRRKQKRKQDLIDTLVADQAFDYSRQTALFVQQAPTDADLRTLLTQDNAEVFFAGRTIAGDVTISGDSCLLDGGGSGDARTETLSSTGKITGDIIIEGSDCTIRGVDFTSTTNVALRFGADVVDVKFVDCVFRPGAGIADGLLGGTAWWVGTGLEGNVTVTNCLVENFTSWLLADWNTESGTPTDPLKRVRIKKNYFKQCGGSIAARGMVGTPIKLVQYMNNKYVSTSTHASHWDCFEANNCKRVEVTGNEASIEDQGLKRGFLQTWSRNGLPWTLKYSGNTPLSNFKVCCKIAHNSTFYAPNSENDQGDFALDLTGTLTNCAHALSFVYKKEDGSTASANKWQEGDYVPENISTYPAPPTGKVVNPSGYSIVMPS